MPKINRRDFLLSSAPLITVPALLSALPHRTTRKSEVPDGLTTSRPFEALVQSSWRWCSQCYVLYYDGYAKKGVCPGGDGHFGGGAGSANYFLQAGGDPKDFAESSTHQGWWRFCDKCYVMFFMGYARGWGIFNTSGPNESNPNFGEMCGVETPYVERLLLLDAA